MKEKSKKILTACIAMLGCTVLALTAVWGVYHQLVFGKYEKITFDENIPNAHISARNNMTFSVSKTVWLKFGGNFGIVNIDEHKYLIVWPTLFHGNTYGFMMSDETQTYTFLVNEQGDLLNSDDFTQEVCLKFENNKDDVRYLLSEFDAWTKAAENKDRSFFD